jgi:hypothetical protein
MKKYEVQLKRDKSNKTTFGPIFEAYMNEEVVVSRDRTESVWYEVSTISPEDGRVYAVLKDILEEGELCDEDSYWGRRWFKEKDRPDI